MSIEIQKRSPLDYLRKIQNDRYNGGTSVETVETFYCKKYPNGDPVVVPDTFVKKVKTVSLSDQNALYEKGLRDFRLVTNNAGQKILKVLDKDGNVAAEGFENVKQLITAMKKFGLKL